MLASYFSFRVCALDL